MKTMHMGCVAVGLFLLSVFFLMPPWTTETVLLGVAPPVFLVAVGISVCRVRGRADEGDHDGKSRE